MKGLGLLLLTIGFFASAFLAVRHADAEGLEWQTIEWSFFVATFALGIVGVVLLRSSAIRSGTESRKLDTDLSVIAESLSALVDKLRRLVGERDRMSVYDVHEWIDSRLASELGRFVDARESLIQLYGLQSYADLMNEFAGSERNINRAWCASADGYVDEVWMCLDHAAAQMTVAHDLLNSYRNRAN